MTARKFKQEAGSIQQLMQTTPSSCY